jgi:hypothetical protein
MRTVFRFKEIMRISYIYLVRLGKFTKIGHAKNPVLRFQQLQCGCPFRYEDFKYFQVVDAPELETVLHTHFMDEKISGEWYEISEKEVEWLKNYIKNYDPKEYFDP